MIKDEKKSHRPLKICFISLQAYPLFNPSVKVAFTGANVDPYLIAKELALDKDFHVSFIVGDYGQEPVEVHENVTVIKSADMNRNLFFGGWRIWKALRMADSHIYIGKSMTLGMAFYNYYCKSYNRKFIWRSAHSFECDGRYIRKHRFRAIVVTCAMRGADLIISQNYDDAQNIKNIFRRPAIVIRNGHNIPTYQQQKRASILWVGNSTPVKRPDLFIKLVRLIPELNFTMICQEGATDKNYKNLISQASHLENLQFFQRVPFNEINDYFLQAKVFVNTSDGEGFPNTFIQSCKCKTPILSLNVNPDDFIFKYECGLCCGGDFNKLVENLKYMLSENRYVNYGKNARKYAEQNHDIKKITEQYKNLFISLMRNLQKQERYKFQNA